MNRFTFHRAVWILMAINFLRANTAEEVVTMLVPGFRVQELPVELSNINNLRFSPAGQLTALGYDGRIHLLRDTDGDGLEDRAETFWDRPTLTVPVGMEWTKEGLYVSSNGKISLFPDRDGDGQADREEIVTTNWVANREISGMVDATAVTTDSDGNVYFALLVENYANPYLLKDGVAHYTTNTMRGTVQKFTPSTGRLQTIATGVRVPYTLAFNKAGDLFMTDQEGETWCPDGNPLDELNWIQPGRNYGFPPPHPKHLPGLISEPPVVSFGPQHQSTCGLVFNESRPGRKPFGPARWEGNAIIAGESRGKIWRTALVKTPFGYLGQETLIARLGMLTTDVAVSPNGDLYVSCHSGPPDWGTGPQGKGKLFRIHYEDRSAPQPVAIWAAGLMEVRVAFDAPVDPAITAHPEDILIEHGEFVRAADRLETLKPPYRVVAAQELVPRGKIKVVSARLSEDRRTLSMVTDPHSSAVPYAMKLPGVASPGRSPTVVDLEYALTGAEVSWTPDGKTEPTWTGWLPHLDSALDEVLVDGSAQHAELVRALAQPGLLHARAKLIVPAGATHLRFQASAPFAVELDGTKAQSVSAGSTVDLPIPPGRTELILSGTLRSNGQEPQFHVAYYSATDPSLRPLPRTALLLPWATPRVIGASGPSPEAYAAGDYERGRGLFFGEQFKCATCHRLRDEGKTIGPDLSNLAYKDATSVLRDIKEPNATINPDYVSYNVVTQEGDEFTGFVRAQDVGAISVTDAMGQARVVSRKSIRRMAASAVSLMPAGLLDSASDGQVHDLLTFLLNAPPRRTRSDLERLLQPIKTNSPSPKPLRIVLVANAQDHGPGQHDYPHWQREFREFLSAAPAVNIETAWDWPATPQFESADVVVFYYWNRGWTKDKFEQLDRYLSKGGGLVLFHSATISDRDPEELAKRIGLAAQAPHTKYIHAPMTLKFVESTAHPITTNFKTLPLLDEPYWPMIGDERQVKVLATAAQEGKDWPMLWTFEPGRGRVFCSIPGHYTWTHQDPAFQLLAVRAIAWAAHENTDRFEKLLRHHHD